MLPKLPAAVFLCALAACQVGQNTPGFNDKPGLTNPTDSTDANGTVAGGGGNTNNAGSGNATDPVPVVSSPVSGPHLIGRIDPNTMLMTWAGTAIEAAFTGTGGTATFSVPGSINCYIGVSVDGAAATRVSVPSGNVATQVPFAATGAGTHKVRFYKLNEGDLGTITFKSMAVKDGALQNYSPSGRRIEFIGDSITVGYGIDGNAPCSNTGALENAFEAWSWNAARALNAEASIIAVSGRGVTRNAVGVTDTVTMPTLYPQLALRGAAAYTFPSASAPQAIVINLGTNDYAYLTYASGSPTASRPLLDQTAFVQAYEAFVASVRQSNPGALIVLATSPMLSDTFPQNSNEKQWSSLEANIKEVAADLADANIVTLSIPPQNTNASLGCESHPGPTEAQAMADLLVPLLKAKLNW